MMIFVVLGMHKSGTTLVSQILHHSGIDMGEFDENVSYDKGNKYERQSVLKLDMEILAAEDDRVMKLRSHRRRPNLEPQLAQMRQLIAECSAAHEDWGFKDPRTLLVYDLWRAELPEHKIVAVYRDAAEVWPRFRWLLGKYHKNFHQAYRYLSIWQDHNLNLLKHLRETDQEYLLLSYRDLMSDDRAFTMLQSFVGRDLVDRRKPGLYRSRSGGDVFLATANAWMKLRLGRSWQDTFAELEAMKTPLIG